MINKYFLAVVVICVFACSTLRAQQYCAAIDTVYSFVPGTGQNNGQDAKYFPANIFGLPSTAAREYVPIVTPDQICSIGMNGVIIVGFKNGILLNKEGADFTIFENAFRHASLGRVYAEPAAIAVSQDGITFVEFPFDSSSLAGCAGVTPTYGDVDPCTPLASGGDSFDLATIGMDSVRYIRIRDVTSIVRDNPAHPLWDPTLSGFDLDAVLGLHVVDLSPVLTGKSPIVSLNGSVLSVALAPAFLPAVVTLYALDGRRLDIGTTISSQQADIPLPSLPRGAYFVHISSHDQQYSKVVFYE